jgi:hypothetical protein
VSSRCPVIREGFNSGYCYLLMQVPGPKRYAEKPDKGKFSHVMNAVEYGCMSEGEDLEIRGRKADDGAYAVQNARHVHDWDGSLGDCSVSPCEKDKIDRLQSNRKISLDGRCGGVALLGGLAAFLAGVIWAIRKDRR